MSLNPLMSLRPLMVNPEAPPKVIDELLRDSCKLSETVSVVLILSFLFVATTFKGYSCTFGFSPSLQWRIVGTFLQTTLGKFQESRLENKSDPF